VARVMRSVRPDLIAAHEAHGLGLAVMARWLVGARAGLVYHRRVDLPVGRWIGSRWKLRAPDLFICISRAVADVLAASGVPRQRIRIVYSGVAPIECEAGAGEALRAELGLSPSARIVGTIGSLVPHKDHLMLLTAFAQLKLRLPDAHLVLIGSGPLRDRLRVQAAAAELSECVHFLGERRDTDRLLSGMDLFVLSSRTEGLGSSILDAFSLGVPVVATKAGGIPDLVEDGRSGRLATPGDPDSLAGAMVRALEDPSGSEAMAAAARQRFLAEFTDRVMTTRTVACYRELLAAATGTDRTA
jgi:glycosyltransferase involved in cell wall biosynthesis